MFKLNIFKLSYASQQTLSVLLAFAPEIKQSSLVNLTAIKL